MRKWERLLANPIVAQTLRAAGWTPERSVDVTRWLDLFQREGVPALPAAISILESFGDLSVKPTRSDTSVFSPSRIDFDPQRFYFPGEGEFFRGGEGPLGVNGCPIGERGDQSGLVLLEDGRLVEDLGQWTFRILGHDFEDALVHMILADHLPPPYKPPPTPSDVPRSNALGMTS